jgi:lysophospholipase L1-like esterase
MHKPRLPHLPFLALTALAGLLHAADLPQVVAPTDPRLHYSGRWDTEDAAGPRCEWPAGQVFFTFEGTDVNGVLGGSKGHAFQAVVDGQPTAVLTLAPGQSVYPVATNLPPGRHSVELCKRTECWGGPVQVKGFQFPADAKLLDPPVFTRRLEFIGDSITAGYGNEAASKEEHFSYATESAWLAWGAVAARTLNAELHCEAISGIWLQDNGTKKPMPALWPNTMPFTASKPWDFSRWQPDAVVVNLGTNDKNQPIVEEKWRAAYVAFVGQIRTAYPKAHIFLVIGPMGQGPDKAIAKYNAAIVAELTAKGDNRLHAVALPDQDWKNGFGADWHPSAKTHQLMADAIVAELRTALEW